MNSTVERRVARCFKVTIVCLGLLAACLVRVALAQPSPTAPAANVNASARLSPPQVEGPIRVRTSFELLGISRIEDEAERITFSGVLTLVWKDPRLAFDPAQEGVTEKVYSGAYQFNEISPVWYPQVTLANASGQFDSKAVLLRVKPDGTSTLRQELEAVAKVSFDMRRFPFDRQRASAIFVLFGYNASEVVLEAASDSAVLDGAWSDVPQWTLGNLAATTRQLDVTNALGASATSAFVVSMDIHRQPMFMLRLVVVPLILIVMLSWAVFWMDRSSVGDRMSVSFVGILTAVAYQITLGGIIPNVSYFTWMNGFLNVSFLFMSATVVVNLYVGIADQRGQARGDFIDRCCRWVFPIAYFGIIVVGTTVVLLRF